MVELTKKQLSETKHFILYLFLHLNELNIMVKHYNKFKTVTEIMILLRYPSHSKTSAFLTDGYSYKLFERKKKGKEVLYRAKTSIIFKAIDIIDQLYCLLI